MKSLGFLVGVAVLATSAPTSVQAQDPDHAVQGGGMLPEGWHARVDRDRGMENILLEENDGALHVKLGPAVILYRAADEASGNFTVTASFKQAEALQHSESYGIFIGGKNLDGADQAYTYFLVRDAGQFLVKKRDGAEAANVTDGWAAHDAVATEIGETNTLVVTATDSEVTFSVNGVEVYSGARDGLFVDGVVGLRTNHNLELSIEGFAVER